MTTQITNQDIERNLDNIANDKPLDIPLKVLDEQFKKQYLKETCSSCRREYYRKNKDKIRLSNKTYRNSKKYKINMIEYYRKNKDKIRLSQKAYRNSNKYKIYRRKYYQRNKDKIKLTRSKYYQRNIDKIKLSLKTYRSTALYVIPHQ